MDLAQKDSGGPAYQGGEVDDLKNSDRKGASEGRRGKIMVLKNQLTLVEYLKTKSASLGSRKIEIGNTRGPKRKFVGQMEGPTVGQKRRHNVGD